MPAIQTIYTGNKKTDEYLSNIYKILNELKEYDEKTALLSDLKDTNKVIEATAHNRQHSLQSTLDHTGTGTQNYVMKSDANGLPSNSIILDNGTNVGVGMTPSYKFDVNGEIRGTDIRLSDNILGTPTYQTIGDFLNFRSAGRISGGAITDNGDGTVAVAAGTGMIKTTDSSVGVNKFIDFSANPSLALTDDQLNYIYVNYSGGSTTIAATTDIANINTHTQFCIGYVFLRGTVAEIIDEAGVNLADHIADNWHRLAHRSIERMTGASVAESGTRYLTVTAAVYYFGNKEIILDAIDTTGTDRFTAVYRDGGTGWTYETNQQQFSNVLYDDGDGTPGDVGVGKYAVYWVYECMEGGIYIQYSQVGTYNLAQAQTAHPPTPPNYLAQFGKLRARIIILNGATNATEIDNNDDDNFVPGAASVHNELSGLQGGTASEYYHLTSAQVSALHARSHALDSTSDHTIGSLTSTYLVKSDGSKLVPATNTDAEVSGAVSASHAAVTVAGAPLTLSGQQITMNYDSGTLDLDGNNLRVKTGVWQPLDADLTAISALASTGFAVRSASDTWLLRSIAVSGNGISISNGDGVAANPTVSLDIGTGATQIAAGNHTHAQLHDRQHSLQSTSDHTGTGTQNYVMKADANGLPSNSVIRDDGTNVGIGTAPSSLLHILGTAPIITLTDSDTGADSQINASSSVGSIYVSADVNNEVVGSLIGFNVDGSTKAIINSAGNLGVGTQSLTARVELYNLKTSTPNYINLQLEDMAHGLTTLASTTVFGVIKANNTSGYAEGGLIVRGLSVAGLCASSVVGLTLEGVLANADPVDTCPAILLKGYKSNGTTGGAVVAAAETVLQVQNYTTAIATILGNGNIGLIEETNPDLPIHISKTGVTSGIKFEQIGYGAWCVGVATGNPTSLAFSINDDLSSPAMLIAAVGSIVCSSTIQAAYKSSAGNSGINATIYSGFSSATFENGILVSAT